MSWQSAENSSLGIKLSKEEPYRGGPSDDTVKNRGTVSWREEHKQESPFMFWFSLKLKQTEDFWTILRWMIHAVEYRVSRYPENFLDGNIYTLYILPEDVFSLPVLILCNSSIVNCLGAEFLRPESCSSSASQLNMGKAFKPMFPVVWVHGLIDSVFRKAAY